MSKKRKKKRKLRVDRIIMVLVVFALIIFFNSERVAIPASLKNLSKRILLSPFPS